MTKVCVIGAGISGLVTIKGLLDEGIAFDCYERSDGIGGVWHYRHDDTDFSVYKSCHTIVCKYQMTLQDDPIPEHYPEYMSHQLMLEYYTNYAKKYSLLDKILFNTEVLHVIPLPNGQWKVITTHCDEAVYDHVIVATGQFHYPKYPRYPGKFNGHRLHSAYYRTSESYRDKNVLVVGLGNSGADIVCELAGVANKVYLSTRESAHIIPKFIWGVPFLKYASIWYEYLPFSLQQALSKMLFWLGRGNVTSYDLPKPKRNIFIKNPTVSSQLLDRVGHGDIIVKPSIKTLLSNGVEFSNGEKIENLYSILYATGFTIRFPFFEPNIISYTKDHFRNYYHVVNLDHKGLYFVGMVDPLGGYPPLFELQAKWVAGIITGKFPLPTKKVMEKSLLKYRKKMCKHYGQSNRPVIRVDFFRYKSLLQALVRERKQHSWHRKRGSKLGEKASISKENHWLRNKFGH